VPPPRVVLPQTSGDLSVPGLQAPVQIVRDRWGIPHIDAATEDDLFFAQGFVQAQDRLFQMDLWRLASSGRLSEVLGANFIERDVVTRRVQPAFLDEDPEQEWAAYPPETREIARAFVRGINAYVGIARRDPPDDFRLAGWLPEPWTPEDLLSRTDAFTASGNAQSEVLRAQVVAGVGAARADVLLPLDPPVRTVVPSGLDPASISYLVGDTLRRAGVPPFFVGLAAPIAGPAASNAWALSGTRTATGRPILANDPHGPILNPSGWYLVHLKAPGWDVAGATEPWAPGVAIGHNERVAWGETALDADVEDLYVERTKPDDPKQVEEEGRWVPMRHAERTLAVKGQRKPFEYDHDFTRHGVIVAIDSERRLAFALRWTGLEPGAAPALAALSIDRAASAGAFRQALTGWKAAPRMFVFADTDGHVGMQAAGLIPVRRNWNGMLPVPGWTGAYEWAGWRRPSNLPGAEDPRSGFVATANEQPASRGAPIGFEWADNARIDRLRDLLSAPATLSVADVARMQHDIHAWNAAQLVPLLAPLHAGDPAIEAARRALLVWDERVSADSSAASIYVAWERALARGLIQAKLGSYLTDQWLRTMGQRFGVLLPAIVRPTTAWFASPPATSRDRLLLDALAAALSDLRSAAGADQSTWAWGRLHTVIFAHPLGITDAARRRYDVGPFPVAGYRDTVMASDGPGFAANWGASFQQVLDVGDWDRSLVIDAPGESEWPDSPHFRDLAARWAQGGDVPLPFSDAAVQASAGEVLTLH
jgi:penicillin G amidase